MVFLKEFLCVNCTVLIDFSQSKAILPLVGGLARWVQLFDLVVLGSCLSVEDFVMSSGLGHGRPHKFASCWRTLSRAVDFDHGGSQGSALCWRTLSCAADFDHTGSLRICPLSEDFVLHSGH